ncbi:MAG TPA: hypothetical protein VGG64_05900 [Pirellulales bacterium]
MTRLRQNCLPLLLVAAAGSATLVVGIAMRRVDGTRAPAFGLQTAPASSVVTDNGPQSPHVGSAKASVWQPVAWNEEATGNSVRVASVESATLPSAQNRPVVKIAQRAVRSVPATAPIVISGSAQDGNYGAEALAASPAAPTVRVVTQPVVAQPAVADPTIAPPATTDAVNVEPSPAPATPVVRAVQRQKLSDLSVLGSDTDEDAAGDSTGDSTEQADEGQPAVDVGGAASRREDVADLSTPEPYVSMNETVAAQRAPVKNDAAPAKSNELFAPPALPRGFGIGLPRISRSTAKNPTSGQAPRGVRGTPNNNRPPVVSAAPESTRDGASEVVDTDAANIDSADRYSANNDSSVVPDDTSVRMVLPNSGGTPISANSNSAPSEPTTDPIVTPNLQQPRSEQFVAESAAPTMASAVTPAPTITSPTVRPATPMPQRPVASAPVSERGMRMRQVPPQPVAPWAMPPTPRAAVASRDAQPVPAPAAKQAPQVAAKPASPPPPVPAVAAQPVPVVDPKPVPPSVTQKNVMVLAPPAVDPSRRTMMPAATPPAPVRQQVQAQRPPAMQQPGFAPAPVPMPLANVPPARPPYLMVVAQRAQEHIDYGFNLAERGAIFSSETEFNEALLLVAQAMDAAEHTHIHSDAMRTAMRAFREADDFVPRDAIEPNISQIVTTHQTPVLKRTDTNQMPLLVAMQEYYTYGQYQLGVAGGHEPTAAAALYGLARLQSVLGTGNDMKKMMCGPKAIALHQAALAIDGTNYAAANELGVLLARYGQWPEAQAAFLQSVCVSPQLESWRNLAVSYESLGDMNAAKNAWGRYELARQAKQTNTVGGGDRPMVNFVDTETFVRASGGPEAGDMSVPQPRAAEQSVAGAPRQGAPPQMQPPQQQTQQPAGQQPVTQARADEYPLNWLKTKVTAAFSSNSNSNSNTAQQTGGQQLQRR